MAQIEKHVLPAKYGGGPQGLGDPDDRTLRRVEIDVLVPKIMRERAKVEKCTDFVKSFENCCVANGFSMILRCRDQNKLMKECLTKWYNDESFIKECTDIYLNDRSEYRRTGIPKKERMNRIKS